MARLMAAGSIPAGQRRSRRILLAFLLVMFAFPFLVVGSSAMLSSVFPGWAARSGLVPDRPLIVRLAEAARYGDQPLAFRETPQPDPTRPTLRSTSYPVPSADEALGKLARACESQRLKIAAPDLRAADPTLLCVGEDRGEEVGVRVRVACAPGCRLDLSVASRAVAGQR